MVLSQRDSACVAGVHTPREASVREACCWYSGVMRMSWTVSRARAARRGSVESAASAGVGGRRGRRGSLADKKGGGGGGGGRARPKERRSAVDVKYLTLGTDMKRQVPSAARCTHLATRCRLPPPTGSAPPPACLLLPLTAATTHDRCADYICCCMDCDGALTAAPKR